MDIINKINRRLNNEHFWFLCNFFSMLEMVLCFIIAGVAVVINSTCTFLVFFILTLLMVFLMAFSYIDGTDIRFKKDIKNIKKGKPEEKFEISKIEMILMVVGFIISSIVIIIIIYSVK